jgi:hypothetical protein
VWEKTFSAKYYSFFLIAFLLGLADIRVPPGNRGVAFIEFQDEIQAGGALRQMNGLAVSAAVALQLAYSN